MRDQTRREFRAFADERTPDLFPVAYALAGRQDAAEKLLQAAMERTYLRWQRLDDPYEFTVRAMRRGALPWWRRWRPGAAAPMPADVSGGRPVDVADLALAGARRRRVVRVSLAAGGLAAVVALALAVPAGLPQWLSPDAADGGPPSPELAGQVVVASMHDGRGTAMVLDPRTGEYVPGGGLVSPDLRYAVDPGSSPETIRLSSTTDGGGLGDVIELPSAYRSFIWSPDSTRLAASDLILGDGVVATDRPDRTLTEKFRNLLIVDVDDRHVREMSLDLPDGRVGIHLAWLDAAHLAVAVTDPEATVAVEPHLEIDFPGGGQIAVGDGPRAVVDEVLLIDLDGAVVDRVPVPQEEYAAGNDPDLIWRPAGATGDGRLLLVRQPDDATLEIAIVDPADGSSDTTTFGLPDAPEDHVRMPVNPRFAFEPLPHDRLLLRGQLVLGQSHPDFGSGAFWRHEYLTIEPEAGTIRPADIPGVDEEARLGSIGGAAWLSPEAAHRAFDP